MKNTIPTILIITALLLLTACTTQTSPTPTSPSDTEPSRSELAKADSCTTDSDCICGGMDPFRERCFLGNKDYYDKYVDKSQDCPDFCTGIAGNLATKCVDNKCIQLYECLTPSDCDKGENCISNKCTGTATTPTPIPTPTPKPSPTPSPTPSPSAECSSNRDCKTGGCSGTVCQPASEPPVMTTCEWRPEYACYKKTACGCISGTCQWDKTEEFNTCVKEASGQMLA
jgi:eight-cysteine-cluster-containing protein